MRRSVERKGKCSVSVVDADAIAEDTDAGSVLADSEVEQAFDVKMYGCSGRRVDLIGRQGTDFGL
jgi:hypothetical protein